jgi:hypothetical protein
LEGRPEEDEDTEDSEESDEELRCYSVQEPSEDSEEEPPAVPVVVAESQSARNLRSLLKMPSLLSEAFCDDLERKKKAVSFFDDVTVYLFDQVGCCFGYTQSWGRLGGSSHTLCSVPPGKPHPRDWGALSQHKGITPYVPGGWPQLTQCHRPATAGWPLS